MKLENDKVTELWQKFGLCRFQMMDSSYGRSSISASSKRQVQVTSTRVSKKEKYSLSESVTGSQQDEAHLC
jgi:hypothetical protein